MPRESDRKGEESGVVERIGRGENFRDFGRERGGKEQKFVLNQVGPTRLPFKITKL